MKQIEWSDESLHDLAALDRKTALRIKHTLERFAETGAGDIKRLKGIDPPEFRLRAGDYRVRFHQAGDTLQILRIRNRKNVYR